MSLSLQGQTPFEIVSNCRAMDKERCFVEATGWDLIQTVEELASEDLYYPVRTLRLNTD